MSAVLHSTPAPSLTDTLLAVVRHRGTDPTIGVLAAAAATIATAPAVPSPALGVWWSAMSLGYMSAVLMRDAPEWLQRLRRVVVAAGWGLALAVSFRAGGALGVTGALLGAQLLWRATEHFAGVADRAAWHTEQGARAEAEVAFLQAVEEIRRLRVDIKTTHELRDTLNTALERCENELVVARTKADALSVALQRVMPFESESGLLKAETLWNVVNREWARVRRHEQPLTIVLVRLDHFAEFEAHGGRIAYEVVTRRVATLLRKAGNRPGDIAGRLARDTFAVVLPETEAHHAVALTDKLRIRIAQLGIKNPDAPDGLLTASAGVATVIPSVDSAVSTLRERAEAALYEASFQGGNRTVRYDLARELRVERWNPDLDGQVTLERLQTRLALGGFVGQRRRYEIGAPARAWRIQTDAVTAVLSGTLKVAVEGQSRVLRPGDCVYFPKGATATAQVEGKRNAVTLEGQRA